MKKHPDWFSIFVAGLIAITVNTLVLKAAPLLDITAESGGLLKLLIMKIGSYVSPDLLSYFKTSTFWLLFHYAIGFGMVLLYVYVFEPLLPGKGWLKGSIFSLLPWIINAFLVLPLLGQGIIGIYQLSTAGIIYFFIANWIFGLVLGLVYERRIKRNL